MLLTMLEPEEMEETISVTDTYSRIAKVTEEMS